MANGTDASPRAFVDAPHDDSQPSNTGWFPPYNAWPPNISRVFPPVVGDPDWCVGHVDDSVTHSHHTHWERFGPDGVVVTQDDGHPARVSLADVDLDAERTPELAALLAFQIAQAELFAARQPVIPPLG